jgi:hypothetical protein
MKKDKLSAIIRTIIFVMMTGIIILGCKKDEPDPPIPVNPLVGSYSFIGATFNNAVTVIVNGDTNHYQPGDDAYLFVGAGLLGAAPCDNADNAALELRANNTSFYVCSGEDNEAQQGTWSSNADNSVLTLNISNPGNFVVAITGLDLSNNMLKGVIPVLPLPYDTSLPVGAPLPGGGINFQTANVSVEFNRID